MNDRIHVGTLLWGVVLTLAGAALAAIGFGWWDISALDLRLVAPLLVIVSGTVILLSALTRADRDRHTDIDLRV